MKDFATKSKIWIVGDTHAYHTNLTRGVSKWSDLSRCRDFDTAEQMTEQVASNINSLVKEEDQLICLGDWAFGGVDNILKFRDMIVCRDVGLLQGNHDRSSDTKLSDGTLAYSYFSFYKEYLELTIRKTKIVLFHYPIQSWNGMNPGSIHLFGHCHSSPENRYFNGGRSMDVGLDGNYLMPYLLDDVIDDLLSRPIKREGHHG